MPPHAEILVEVQLVCMPENMQTVGIPPVSLKGKNMQTPQIMAIPGMTPLGLATHARTPAQFAELWEHAKAAANHAAIAQNNRLRNENERGFDCGFAWVVIPGTHAFGKWAKKAGIASKHYPKGLCIWYTKLHNQPTQSISVHEAAARAARDVLSHGLQSSEIEMGSRLD